jgi:tRNA1(Val) A37 N6-methylase TrmN6
MDGKRFKSVKYGGISVYYVPHLDGGGTSYGQDFIPIVRKNFKKLNRVCEFGSGPGFIGFSLLGNGLCKSLCLIDINKEAIDACNYTIKANGLQGKAKAYLSDGLGKVPKSEKWDLVVSNPPHLDGSNKEYGMDLIAVDPEWRIHKAFYKNVSKFLNPGGSIIFVENGAGSNAEQWFKMIRENGLKPVKSFTYKGIKRSDNQILLLFVDRLFESLMDGTAVSKGLGFYVHNFKKFVSGAYKQNKFYFVWSKKA